MGPALKTLLFTFVVPGTVTVLIPYFIVTRTEAWSAGPIRYAGIPFMCIGIAIYARCARDFAVRGRGTPAPIDSPKVLIIHGLYRYVRNPMYVGVLTVLLGEIIWFRSPILLVYSGFFFALFNIFVRLYEEPKLLHLFGGRYTAYRMEVPRWWPHITRRKE